MKTGRSSADETTSPDISGAVTGVLVRYVRSVAGQYGVRRVLSRAREQRRPGTLEDPTTWSSPDQIIALIDAAAGLLGDPEIAFRLGQEMVRQYRDTAVAPLIESTGSASRAIEAGAAVLQRLSPSVAVQILEKDRDHAAVKVRARRGRKRLLCMCDLTKGLLSELPTFFDAGHATVEHPECQARGGRFCLYALSWNNPARIAPEPDSEVAVDVPEDQVRDLAVRLDEAYSSAADLLVTDDPSSALGRIAARAAKAVDSPRYILIVTAPGGSSPDIHSGGLSTEESEPLAAELESDWGGERPTDVLVVEVESPTNHYGRFAVYAPQSGFAKDDSQVVSAFATYAAATLDVASAIERARRSDESANALLEFSRALAGASTVDDVAWRLAQTVPVVAGCDRSTVMLWDPLQQELVVRAATGPGADAARDDPEQRAGYRLTRESTPLFERVLATHELIVVDADTDDETVRSILEQTGTACSVIAPLATPDEFFGIVTANFDSPPANSIRADLELQSRMIGLADHAVTAMQNTRLLEKVTHLAWHDALTGLPNRRLLEDRVNQELERAKRSGESTCMFFVDLDRLKQVNDTFGHAAGDELIRNAGQRLVDTVRRQDTVARLGGDEFAVLLPGLADLGDIDTLARRTLAALRTRYTFEEADLGVSGSIGVAVAPGHGETYDELLANADAAMYRAKSLGRDTYQLYSIPDGGARPDVQLEIDLKHAIERAEMTVLYQPVVEIQSSEVVAVEALARWQHPVRGLIDPGWFIGIARDPEVIAGIDAWVVGEACRQMAAWTAEGIRALRMSVNVAASSLTSEAFSRSVETALQASRVDPAMLELEVTDLSALESDGPARQSVEHLLSVGIRFAVDDVGSASLAFSRIGSIPISTLKLDSSFVHLLDDDDDAATLVGAIVGLTSRHGIRCVAEGVETQQQARALLEKGCRLGQGFLFSPPLLPGDVDQMLRS
jgi:diguanylate cyclase (GGDEF)-like protein